MSLSENEYALQLVISYNKAQLKVRLVGRSSRKDQLARMIFAAPEFALTGF
jgi:hypothetical protein